MTIQKTKDFIVRSIENTRGDDLARCKRAFKDFTAKQMQEQHGQSGKTRREILDTYWNHDKDCNDAIFLVTTCIK